MKSESAISSMASVPGGELQQSTDTPKVEEQQPGVSLDVGVLATKETKPPSPIVVYKQGYNGPMDKDRMDIFLDSNLLGS